MRRLAPLGVFAAVVALAFAWAVPAALLAPLPDGANDFNSPGFVARHSWSKFALLATRPFTGTPSRAEEDAKVARFFELNAAIARQERIAGDPASTPDAAAEARAQEAQLRDERAGLKNTVALILEGRLTHVVEEAGLTRRFGGDIVWPPVNIAFQDPPKVLVKSPRSEIRKESESLLQADLPIAKVQEVEAHAERDGETSALVVDISGIAMYPAIIPDDADYGYVMEAIAHEWVHHYLYFTPLGRAYFDSGKLTTLNETVADIAGREMGDMLVEEYPLQPAASSGARLTSAASDGIDFTAEMRNLRRAVEALLTQGRIDDAERLMDEKRQFLADNGYYIRKLNQAYFAFHGSYADSAGSVDPIGPKLDSLRAQSTSLKQFVERARAITSERDLDAAIAGG